MSHWSEKTGSITYELGTTVELRSFPFTDGVVDTPSVNGKLLNRWCC